MRKIRVSDWQQTHTLRVPNSESIALSRGGLVVASNNNMLEELLVVDPDTLDAKRRLQMPARWVAGSPEHDWMLGTVGSKLELFNLETGAYQSIPVPETVPIRLVSVSRDGEDYFAYGNSLHHFRRTGARLKLISSSHPMITSYSGRRIELSGDGQWVAISQAGKLRLPGTYKEENALGVHWFDVNQLPNNAIRLDTSLENTASVYDHHGKRFFVAGRKGEIMEYNARGERQGSFQAIVRDVRQMLIHPQQNGMLVVGDGLAWIDFAPPPPPETVVIQPPPVKTPPAIPPKPIPPPAIPKPDPTIPEVRMDNQHQVKDITDPNEKLVRVLKIEPPILREFSPHAFWSDDGRLLSVLEQDSSSGSRVPLHIRKFSIPDFTQVAHRVVPQIQRPHDCWVTSEGLILNSPTTRKLCLVNLDGEVEKEQKSVYFNHVTHSAGSPFLYYIDSVIHRYDIRTHDTIRISDMEPQAGKNHRLDGIKLSHDGNQMLVFSNRIEYGLYQINDTQLEKIASNALGYSYGYSLKTEIHSVANQWLVRPGFSELLLFSSALEPKTKIATTLEHAFSLDVVTNKIYQAGKDTLDVYSLDGQREQTFKVPIKKAKQIIPHPSGRKMIVVADGLYWIELPNE